MKKTKKALASLAIAGMVLSMAPMSVFAADATTRLSGADRVATAISIATNGWAAGSDNVIVVSADDANIVDALAAAPLAGQLNAPILVTYKGALDPQVQQKIVELKAKNVYAIGALSDATVASLKAISGVTVEQLQGADRTETAAKVTAKLSKVNGSFVVAYDGKADALSAASFAAANSYSIVIANPDGTIPSNEKVVAPTYTVGGQVSVTGATPLQGADRYATNTAVVNGLTYSYAKVYVANGESLVDALAGAPLAAMTKSPIVLADATQAVTAANDNLTATSQVIALGGAGAVSDAVLGQVSYQVPATLAVASVSAINGSQLQVVFNKAVNKSSLIDTNGHLVPAVEIKRIPDTSADNRIVTSNLLASLSSDKMTLTLTADTQVSSPVWFDGTYTVYIPKNAVTAYANGELLPSYTTTVSASDATAPTVTSVTFNAATNKIDVKMSEPVVTAPTVTVNGGAPLTSPTLSSTRTTYSYANTWTLGTTLDVKVFGSIDANGNEQASTYGSSVTLTQDTSAPTVTSVSQSDSNVVKVVFSKAPNGSTDADKANTVKNAIKVYRAGTLINLAAIASPVVVDSSDSSKLTYKVYLDTTGAPDYAFYDGNDSVTLTVDVADEAFVDVYGISNVGEITKTVTMTKDTTAPVINNVQLNSGNDAILVFFNENVKDSTTHGAISIRQDGIDVTGQFTVGTGAVVDDQVIQFNHTGDIPAGVYTIRFDDGAIKDTAGNDIDAVTKSITVSSTDSAVVISRIAQNGTNGYQVTFNGAVGTSALNASNYTLDGAALPSGTDIYFANTTKQLVNIVLPSNSVNYNSTTSVLRVANVLDSNGSEVAAKSDIVTVVDNVDPTLVSANVNGNIITLNFNEDMSTTASGITTFAGLLGQVSIKGGTVALTGTTGSLSTSVDGSKVVIVIAANGDSNWNTVKAYANLTIKTLDTATLLTDDGASLNPVKSDVSVSAPVTH